MNLTKLTTKALLFLASSTLSLVTIDTVKPVLAASLTIISEVNDSPGFKEVDNANLNQSVKNGDFTITRTGVDNILGNGADESTTWAFDLSKNVKSIDGLFSAFLTLDITPLGDIVSTDGLRIVPKDTPIPLKTERPFIYVANDIPSLLENQGTQRVVNLNLLDFYTPAQISNVFNTNKSTIPFYYADDSSISSAKLTLKFTNVPEPSSVFGLFGLSILGVTSVIYRKTQVRSTEA